MEMWVGVPQATWGQLPPAVRPSAARLRSCPQKKNRQRPGADGDCYADFKL